MQRVQLTTLRVQLKGACKTGHIGHQGVPMPPPRLIMLHVFPALTALHLEVRVAKGCQWRRPG